MSDCLIYYIEMFNLALYISRLSKSKSPVLLMQATISFWVVRVDVSLSGADYELCVLLHNAGSV